MQTATDTVYDNKGCLWQSQANNTTGIIQQLLNATCGSFTSESLTTLSIAASWKLLSAISYKKEKLKKLVASVFLQYIDKK